MADSEDAKGSEAAPPTTTHSQYDQCISWVQDRILLKGFKPEMWGVQEDEMAIDFISNPNTRRLLAVISAEGSLVVATKNFDSLQLVDVKEICYFIRPENESLNSSNIGSLVEFGTLSGSSVHSLLRLMNGVFSSQIFKTTAWPESIKKDFTGHYHRFMASLTEAANSSSGKTVLYLPGEEITDISTAAKDKDLVQQLDSIVIHWTRQIKEVVNNHDNAYNAEISGPLEEINFWRSRTVDLSGISTQLHRDDVKKVVAVLEAAKSSYLGPFETLSQRIKEGSIEAEDNLKFLELITEPCQKLAAAEPKQIPQILPSLLHCIRMISTLSKFYNTEDRLTGLLRKISNQIIRRCCDQISLDEIFKGDVEASMVSLDETIRCGVAWKQIYRRTAKAINMTNDSGTQKWKFDEASIFAQIDAFVQRCRDLLEVCEGQIQFARKSSSTKGESGPLPEFGGTKGAEITKALLDIEASFETQIERLRKLDYEILDVKTSRWHDDYNFFKNGVKDLEVMYANVITTAFDGVTQVSAGVILLEIFYSLAKRLGIKRCVEKKTADIYSLFIKQCQSIRSEFDEKRKAPPLRPNEPQYAGTALWARSLSVMVQEAWAMLQDAKYLVTTRESMEAEEVFNKLMGVLNDFKSQHYQHWVETLEEIDSTELQKRLEQPLIKKITTAADSEQFDVPLGHLVCNFDQQLLALFTEVHYWEKFHGEFTIPYVAHDICNQREKLRIMREHVMLVVRAYNDILSDLSTDERRLFTDHIRRLDKRINQGLKQLTWASRGVTEYYVRDCCLQSSETHDIVKRFHAGKDIISKNCKQISSMLLVKIDKNMVYDEGVFESKQNEYRVRVKLILERAYKEIKQTMKEVYVNFKDGSGEVRREWRSFCISTDATVELALRTTVKKSLQELSKAINGDAKTEPQTLFRVNIVLENNRVDYRPTMINLTHVVNIVAKELISCLGVVPRLNHAVLTDEAEAEDKKDDQESFYTIISQDEDTLKIVVSIMNGMSASATELQKYLSYWDKYKPLWEMDKESFIRRYAKANRPLKSYDNDVSRYKDQQAEITAEEISHTINFIKIDCTLLKTSLVNHCTVWQNKLTGLLNQNAFQQLRDLHSLFESNTKKLTTPPLNLDTLSESINLMRDLKTDLPEIEKKFGPLEDMYSTLSRFDVQITDEEHLMLDNLEIEWQSFNGMLGDVEKMLEKSKVNMKRDLETSVESYSEHVIDLRKQVVVALPFKAEFSKEQAFALIEEYKGKAANARALQASLKPGLDIFGIDMIEHKEMKDTERDLQFMNQIWTLQSDWDAVWDKWRGGVFRALDVEEMEIASGNYTKTIGKLRREIASWGIWSAMRNKVDQFKQTLPLIQDLRSEALRPRHWASLKKEINKDFDQDSQEFTLDKIFSLGLHNYSDFIGEMSANANKELTMERKIAEIQTRWQDVPICMDEYKDTFKIVSTDDLFQFLEDDAVELSSQKASKYYNSFKDSIDALDKMLSTTSEIVEMILTVQRKWMYLESIFMAGGDISKQLPEEHALFVTVNNGFKEVMARVYNNTRHTTDDKKNTGPNAQEACGHPGMLEEVTEFDNKLEKIQKSLDQYLETKRMLFPRFYFVSDDDLLEILGQSKNPKEVQKHIKKCFEGIKVLNLAFPYGEDGICHAKGGTSPDGETMTFQRHDPSGNDKFFDFVELKDAVELWLVEVEKAMKLGLQRLLSLTIQGYKGKKKENWVKQWQGGLLITTGAIGWTADCAKALNSISGGNKNAMKSLKKKQIGYLNRLTDLVRDPKLGKIDRKKTVALITMEIHNRDVMERMIKANCSNVQDFEWLSQLRFIFNKEEGPFGTCIVKQTNCTLSYSYEYQGNNGRLVVTPLTDRCVLTLLTAMFLHRGGNPLGPAGTGKTETVKDLGKNLAKYVVVINCSDGMDYKSVGRIFSGLCQSGSWGCFDEFNRIKIEVISVVAMQVLSIVNAQRAHQSPFSFMGQIIPCSMEAGIFITMNPGYAGRTALPDNLKALMRPVAMMAPDLNLIAEVMLAAEGFAEARALAKKTITLYNLMQQQLSKQDHYDYGLRNLKAVLNMAGSLKRADASVNEESILMRALRDMNLPKFIEDDLVLFRLLLGDLFPGLELPTSTYENLQKGLERELDRKGLQKHPFLLAKIIQLYDSQLTRHCNMLVGGTMSGKSTVWKTLTQAKTSMSKEDKQEDVFPVTVHVINSKSITLSELYGAYDLQTFEWADGILSTIFKKAAEDDKPDEKWILFDGPIDAMWIESMNSVMDDNKILTLINGDRIPLTNSMALLFEVEDLAVASPATVSRAGMIYIDSASMGWRPYMESWINRKFGEDADDVAFHKELFNKYVDKVLDFKDHNCREPVPITDFNAVKSLIDLYDTLAVPANGVEKVDGEAPAKYQQMCEKWFVFSMIWTVMAAVDGPSRVLLDQCLREIEAQFPPMQTVYDYYIDIKKQDFELWEGKLTNWRPRKGAEFSQLIVPTIDTIRNSYILTSLVNNKKRVLVSGNTGTGKTVLCQNMLQNLPETHTSLIINFSSATDSGTTQAIIESIMEKRSKDKVGPSGGKQAVIFIDDLNMPKKTSAESPFQPPLELLRLWMDYGGWYDREKCMWRNVLDSQLVTAMAPPTGGREVISFRTQARFSLLFCTEPNDSQVIRIFESILTPKLSEFENEIKPMGSFIARATLAAYKEVVQIFLPTPAKSHYLFNMRDIAKVVQGIVGCDRAYIDSKDSMVKLWAHECMRAMSDRFLKDSQKDEANFVKILTKTMKDVFDYSWDSLMDESVDPDTGPVFCSFMKESGDNALPYEEVSSISTLKHFLEEKLEDYNMEPKLLAMDLVLFDDAIKHVTRIHRILKQSRGNMMLVGVGGSGRQSLTRLASFTAEIDVFMIEITKQYRSIEFREDLKRLYLRAGCDNKVTTFLFNDTQIKEDSFLEDVNNILSSGEVPNLFPKEELGAVYDGVRKGCVQAGIDETPDNMWKFFINRVRSNLHVILAMSPIGAGFRTRCRMYPGLVNCTTIDWFHTWPEDALQEVATKFLAEIQLEEERHRSDIAKVFALTHLSVIESSTKMIEELKRYNYVTPTNYLELVKGYLELLAEKRKELGDQRSKLSNGLMKLDEGKEQVEVMQVELKKKQVIVDKSQQECEKLLVVIVGEKRTADEQKKTVEADSERIGKEEKECMAIAADAEADLAVAMPALERAMEEVDKLDKSSISEIKAYASPPKPVATTLECVMIFMGNKTDWASAKKAIGASDFLAQIKGFDKNNIKDSIIAKAKKYITRPDFTADAIRSVSVAAGALCVWCHAIFLYANVAKEVAPKRAKLKAAQKTLAVKQADLKKAKDALAVVEAKVAELNANFEKSKAEEKALKDEANLLKSNLEKAEKLINGLSGEYERWSASVGGFEKSIKDLVGDSLIASGFLSYAGPFDTVYRTELVGSWMKAVKGSSLPNSDNFKFDKFLAKPTDVRDWNIDGLPKDQFSTENGVITTRCSRWPLMIDPQGQANKWIRNMYKKDLKIIDLKMKDFLRDVENAITYGSPILLQDVLEELDPSLEPVLSKAIKKVGNRSIIKLGDKELDYSEDFKLYITTKMGNPHYTPEVSTKTTVVNFAVKQQGLEAQLLGVVVAQEEPTLEEQKSELTLRVAKGKRKLVDLEDEILRLLSESTGSLLEDAVLIDTLEVSKETSREVTTQLKVSEDTEVKIDASRELFRPAAIRSSIAYFVLNDMARVDPMYQFSLDAYVDLFNKSIVDSRDPSGGSQGNVKERVATINTHHTLQVYRTTCVGLFERHKLLFSLQLCIKIMQRENKIPQSEFDFFCFGGVVVDRSDQKANPTNWIDEASWDNLAELDKLGPFNGLISSVDQSQREWKAWFMSSAPEKEPLPGDWDNKLTELQQMCVLRSLRADRVLFAASIFVGNNMGAEYADPPPFDLGEIFKSSTNKTPLIFVLSPGVDPTASVQQLADSKGIKVEQVALGQGQAPVAMRTMKEGLKMGTWTLLANCHLMLSWMPQLEKAVEAYCDEATNGKIHPNFRLWLSSSPNPQFPITLLQRGVKMTTEPPRGLRSNLLKLYNLISEEKFAECGQQFKYKKLIFALSWFHASLLERRKFKALGFNIPYEFNESDYLICHDLIIVFLDEYPEVTPFDAMRYLISDANYGGRVTDDWDRRLVNTYMHQFICEETINMDNYPLSELSDYYVPSDGDLKSYKEYIKTLPTSDHPAAFGQHPNADISSQIEDTVDLLGTIISLQPKVIVEGAETPMQKLSKQVNGMKDSVPKPFKIREIKKSMSARGDPDALKTVLYQEVERYNVLLGRLAKAMVDVEKATLGLVVVTPALEATMNSLLEFSVPSSWHVAYPSTKGLASWMRDLVERIKQMSDWIDKELPKVFWLAGFTYPTGFLTALLQTTARKNGIAIDTLSWEFPIMTQTAEDFQTGAKEGAYITGMFLEGARWDGAGACLSEPLPMELTSSMPIIHFKPSDGKKKSNKNSYNCPVYMYPIRTGSRERPSYVITVDLKCGSKSSEFWIKRGVALLLSTST